jgi:hypothetical protein
MVHYWVSHNAGQTHIHQAKTIRQQPNLPWKPKLAVEVHQRRLVVSHRAGSGGDFRGRAYVSMWFHVYIYKFISLYIYLLLLLFWLFESVSIWFYMNSVTKKPNEDEPNMKKPLFLTVNPPSSLWFLRAKVVW